jgi:hypothetical protein
MTHPPFQGFENTQYVPIEYWEKQAFQQLTKERVQLEVAIHAFKQGYFLPAYPQVIVKNDELYHSVLVRAAALGLPMDKIWQ